MQENNLLVSVVIPLYNKEQTVVHTLGTVIAQTYNNFEVIIVDDGSTDNSVQVIRDNFDDKRIRIIHQENGGVSSARNRGIEESKGELIAFLDADDEWLEDYLETVVTAACKYKNANIILSGRYTQDYVSKVRHCNVPKRYAGKTVRIDFFENPHVFVHISATVIRDTCLKPQAGWNRFVVGQKSNEDFTFIFRVAMHCQNILYIGYPLSVYNGNVIGQATHTLQSEKRLGDSVLFRNLVWNEYPQMNEGVNKRKFRLFMKYELRHAILCQIRDNNVAGIPQMLNSLSDLCRRNCLCKLEKFMYTKHPLSFYTKLYIYFTKVIWKLHGYPQTK